MTEVQHGRQFQCEEQKIIFFKLNVHPKGEKGGLFVFTNSDFILFQIIIQVFKSCLYFTYSKGN